MPALRALLNIGESVSFGAFPYVTNICLWDRLWLLCVGQWERDGKQNRGDSVDHAASRSAPTARRGSSVLFVALPALLGWFFFVAGDAHRRGPISRHRAVYPVRASPRRMLPASL